MAKKIVLYRGTNDENEFLFDKTKMKFELGIAEGGGHWPIWFSVDKSIAQDYAERPGKIYTAEFLKGAKIKEFRTSLENDDRILEPSRTDKGKWSIRKEIMSQVLRPLGQAQPLIRGLIKWWFQNGAYQASDLHELSMFDLFMYPGFFEVMKKSGYSHIVISKQANSTTHDSADAYGIIDPNVLKVTKIEELK